MKKIVSRGVGNFKIWGGGGGDVITNADSYEKLTDYIILFITYIILKYIVLNKKSSFVYFLDNLVGISKS